jgi:hypothetical protein
MRCRHNEVNAEQLHEYATAETFRPVAVRNKQRQDASVERGCD